MVITEPNVPTARDLDSKLYPSNMPRTLNNDLTRFTQSFFRVRQNRASERKTLLAGYPSSTNHFKLSCLVEPLSYFGKWSCKSFLTLGFFTIRLQKGNANHRFSWGNVPPKWGIIITMSLATFLLSNSSFSLRRPHELRNAGHSCSLRKALML